MKDGKGSCYEGEFIANRKHGQGVLILGRTNEHYEGEFKDDLMDGFGKITYANGDIYLGNFTKGKKNGKGKYTIKDRYELDGNWEMEVKHGDFVER